MRIGVLAAAMAIVVPGLARAEPDLQAMSAGELAAFTRALPKGGELHNHLGGNVFGETLLGWAAEDGLCVDVQALAIVPACTPGDTLKPASAVLADDTLRGALLDSLSVRHPGFRDRLGHDQFFSTFGRWTIAPKRAGDILALAMDTLAGENTFYLEAMTSARSPAVPALAAKVGWKGDLATQKAALTAAGLETLTPEVVAAVDASEARARDVLKCGTPLARPGCQVTVRYLVQTSRILPPEQTFAQLQLGVALVAADKRFVGLQLVAPEDHPLSLANYSLHMRMVAFLTDHGRRTPVALHAGELSLKYATPAELSYHVTDAVRVAGARRIGHGTDIAQEKDAETLAAEMAAAGVLVEVNLSSNASILEVDAKHHPYAWLRRRGVPTSLSTDDAGVLRIDLTHEYAAAVETGATYEDLRRSARNAIAFSFLAGEGLWQDPNVYRKPAAACGGQIGQAAPKGACAALVAASDKAREQWRHETLLAAFEAAHR